MIEKGGKTTMKVFLISILLLVSGLAQADCQYNGKTVSEGTVIGPYTCVNGKWV
jgi:hypothetical protein